MTEINPYSTFKIADLHLPLTLTEKCSLYSTLAGHEFRPVDERVWRCDYERMTALEMMSEHNTIETRRRVLDHFYRIERGPDGAAIMMRRVA